MKTTNITAQTHAGLKIELTLIDELIIATLIDSFKQLPVDPDTQSVSVDVDMLKDTIAFLSKCTTVNLDEIAIHPFKEHDHDNA